MHDKVRQVTGHRKSTIASCIEAKDGTVITDPDKMLQRWKEYISDLFADNRDDRPTIQKPGGNAIMEEEIKKALNHMAKGKAAGPDGVVVEMLTALEDFGVNRITRLVNKIYAEGHFPAEMCKSTFITLPKKPGATKCELHRTISLMSHLTKLLLRVLLDRLRGRTAGEVAEQYGFTPDKGTRNAVFVLKMLAERAVEMQKDVYVCFIDYVKAFDRVRHGPLVEMLESLDLDGQDVELIKNLYWDQKASGRLNGIVSDYVEVMRGVRQGCILSPDLFSLYTEMIMRHIKDLDGLRVGGVNINNLRYADDTTLIAVDEQKLQKLMEVVVEKSEAKGLDINKKSFVMVFSKNAIKPTCHNHSKGRIIGTGESVYVSRQYGDSRCKIRPGNKKTNWYCQNSVQEDGMRPVIKKRDNVNTVTTVEMLCLVQVVVLL